MNLFRQKAIDNVRQRLWGDLLIVQPPKIGFIVTAFLLTILAISAYLYWGQYSLKVSGSGELVPLEGIAKIYAPKNGTIASVFVTEGEVVKQGQRLFGIQVTRTNQDGKELDQTLIQTVRDKIGLIEGNRQNEQHRHKGALARLTEDRQRNLKILEQVEEQIILQNTIISNVEDILDDTSELLEKGYIARVEYNARKERLLNHTQQLAAFKRQKIELENEIERYSGDTEELSASYQQRVLQFDSEFLSLQEQLASYESDRFTFVTAPKNGIVSGIQAVSGSSVNGRIPLLSIVPQKQELMAHLYVPANAIGFVKRHQAVKLMFEAYDYRKFGAYNGVVIDITDVLFTSSEVTPNISLSEPSYRLTVRLDQQFIDAYGEQVSLRANMRLSADIILTPRRLYEWLTDPFTRFQKAA